MRLRRESDILGMPFSSIGPNLSVLGKSLRRTAIVAQNEPISGSAAAQAPAVGLHAPSRHSVKVKCPDWNLDRHKLFEGPCKPKQRESPADEEA